MKDKNKFIINTQIGITENKFLAEQSKAKGMTKTMYLRMLIRDEMRRVRKGTISAIHDERPYPNT